MSARQHLCFGLAACLMAASPVQAQQPVPPGAPVQPDPLPSAIPSIIFGPEDMQKIRQAMEAFRTHKEEVVEEDNDIISEVVGKSERPSVVYYPQFFLDSIVLHREDDWIVWVNGLKLTPTQKQQDRLEVVQVTRTFVKLRWTPVSMQRIAQQFKESHGAAVELDEDNGAVIFTLYPNQTFTSQTMNIIEGRQAPVAIESTSLTNEIGQKIREGVQAIKGTQEKEGSGKSAKAPAEGKSNEGLGGLINRYERLNQVDPLPAQGR